MSEEEVALSREEETPSKNLGAMLKSQYLSKEFNDIFASTELREFEIHGMAKLFATRFVNMVLGTEPEDLEGLAGEERKNMQERLAIKRRIMNNDNAMVYAIQDSYMYGIALCRQSLSRQSRREALMITSNPRTITIARDVGLRDKLFTKLGVSRKYRQEYVEKV